MILDSKKERSLDSKLWTLIIGRLFAAVLLVTWLVWATGDVTSPYTALYIVIIAVSSLLLGSRAAIVTSVGCAAACTGMSLFAASGLLPRFARLALETSTVKTIQTVGFNDVAFLVVGLL